jgi:type IV secretory pathway VirB10-like protein
VAWVEVEIPGRDPVGEPMIEVENPDYVPETTIEHPAVVCPAPEEEAQPVDKETVKKSEKQESEKQESEKQTSKTQKTEASEVASTSAGSTSSTSSAEAPVVYVNG